MMGANLLYGGIYRPPIAGMRLVSIGNEEGHGRRQRRGTESGEMEARLFSEQRIQKMESKEWNLRAAIQIL